MRTRIVRLVLSLALLAAPGAHAAVEVVKESLTVEMPYGEAAFPLCRHTRTPNTFFQPLIFFTDKAGATKDDARLVEQLGSAGAWAVLVDLKDFQARLADEDQFAAGLDALARAVQGKMSEAIGPRLKGTPERIWPMTFAGRGAGAVRAVEAAIRYKAFGGVRGVMLISPAGEAPSLDKSGAPFVLSDLFQKLSVTPVAFIAPPQDARILALSKQTIGYSDLRTTLPEGLSYISMFYQIRHRRDPEKAPPAPNPADLFRPGP